MRLQKETLGRLSIIFAVVGFVLPFVLGFINAVLNPDDTGKSPYLGILFIFLQLTAIICAICAGKTRNAKVGVGCSVASLVFLFGLAYFMFYHQVEEPKKQALAFYRALHDQNWRKLWYLTRFTGRESRVWRTPEIYERDMLQNLLDPDTRLAFNDFSEVQDFAVANPRFEIDGAHLSTTATITRNGRVLHLNGSAHLIEQGGTWKVIIDEYETDDPFVGYCRFLGIPYHPQNQ
jgi:hypothetical protein